MSRRPPTFYVLHGTDEFSLRAQIQAMRAQMGDPATAELNTAMFDGKAATAADVLSAAQSIPFLSEKRLVIVEGMLTWLARKGGGKPAKAELDVLAAGLKDLPDWARVVFAEPDTLSDKNPILALARTTPGGFHKAFNVPQNAAAWIIRQAKEAYETAIEPQAAVALAAVIGSDLRAADSELAKLAAYVDGTRAITEQDVALLTSYVSEANVFEMVDALGKRDGAKASRLLHRLLDDDDPFSLFGMMIRQFRLLIQAREYLDAGGNPKQTGKALGVHPFVGEKVAAQARFFSCEQLDQIYHYLLDTDVGIKTGKVEARLALDLFIAGVSS